MSDNKRHEGTVSWFNAAKYYGFITPSDGGKDWWFHGSQVRCNVEDLQTGTKVSYVLRREAPDKPLRAHEVMTVDG